MNFLFWKSCSDMWRLTVRIGEQYKRQLVLGPPKNKASTLDRLNSTENRIKLLNTKQNRKLLR